MESHPIIPSPPKNPLGATASFVECGVSTLRYSFYQIARQFSLCTKCLSLIAVTTYFLIWASFSKFTDSVFYEYPILLVLEIAVYFFKMEYAPGRELELNRELPVKFDQTIDNNGSHANLKDDSIAQAGLYESIPINIKVTDNLRPIKDVENPSPLPKKEAEDPLALIHVEDLPPIVEEESVQISIQMPPPDPVPMPAMNLIADPDQDDGENEKDQWEDEEDEWESISEAPPSDSSEEEEKKEEEKKPEEPQEPSSEEEPSNEEDYYEDDEEEMGDKKDETDPLLFGVGKEKIRCPANFDPDNPWGWTMDSRKDLAEAGKKMLERLPETKTQPTATAQALATTTVLTTAGTETITAPAQDPVQAPFHTQGQAPAPEKQAQATVSTQPPVPVPVPAEPTPAQTGPTKPTLAPTPVQTTTAQAKSSTTPAEQPPFKY